jgi:hypothetical protein
MSDGFLALAILIPVGLAVFVTSLVRANRIVSRWAAQEHWTLIRRKRILSPFHWMSWRVSNVQAVFRVSARDASGHVVEGWLIVGSAILGLFSSKVIFVDNQLREVQPVQEGRQIPNPPQVCAAPIATHPERVD